MPWHAHVPAHKMDEDERADSGECHYSSRSVDGKGLVGCCISQLVVVCRTGHELSCLSYSVHRTKVTLCNTNFHPNENAPDSGATSSAKHTESGASDGSAAVARRWRRDATWLRSDAAFRMSTPRQARQRSGRPGACASLGASSQLLHAALYIEQAEQAERALSARS